MVDKKEKAANSSAKKRPFLVWAKERSVVPTAMGASIALSIDTKKEITEAEFIAALDKYGREPSAKK